MKYVVSILISLVVTGGLVNAQDFKTELAYSFIIDKSQNVANINIVNYTKNERIELRFLSRYGYSHLGVEAISFSENALERAVVPLLIIFLT